MEMNILIIVAIDEDVNVKFEYSGLDTSSILSKIYVSVQPFNKYAYPIYKFNKRKYSSSREVGKVLFLA